MNYHVLFCLAMMWINIAKSMDTHDHVKTMLHSELKDLQELYNSWREMDDNSFTIAVRQATKTEFSNLSSDSKANAKVIYMDRLQKLIEEKEQALKSYQ